MGEKKGIMIMGIPVGKKVIIALVAVVVVVLLLSVLKARANARRDALAREEALKRSEAFRTGEPVVIDYKAQLQARLVEKYGTAPEGFEWDVLGNPVALGSNKELTAEDILYVFLRSLSVLDFSTAERYSKNSMVVKKYKEYYSHATSRITNYYINFLRKQYKKSLESLEIVDVGGAAVFADGSRVASVEIDVMDLTDKNFWLKDRDNLFKDLRDYKEQEGDLVKLQQRVYEYLLDAYNNGSVGKRRVVIDLVIGHGDSGGFLISGDMELNALLSYENGVDVASYIFKDFEAWYRDVMIQERIDAAGSVVQEEPLKGESGDGDSLREEAESK